MAFLIFYITHPDEETARRIGTQLVEKRLAACVNVFPVSSAYWWDSTVHLDNEWVSVLKTRIELEAELEASVRHAHPYDVPCILRFEARANADYEQWIRDSTEQ
ncbi:MAG: divalent-cation tolerance protein CutA [Saprospiraceae bacterium]